MSIKYAGGAKKGVKMHRKLQEIRKNERFLMRNRQEIYVFCD